MTLYGVGLGPGDAELVTVRGKRVLEDADVVYTPGRLSRTVAEAHVPESRIGDLDFPMTTDPDELRAAWKEAAAEVAPRARGGDAAFVTLGDPNVYSTFGHLRRTMAQFHPDVDLAVVPGVSSVTAFATALDVEVEAGAGLALREAAGGASPTGPDRMLLFKVTDAPGTHEGLADAGYDVTYGRRLFMEQGETLVTDDPEEVADRDYYTLAYAERSDLDIPQPTAEFEVEDVPESDATRTDGGTVAEERATGCTHGGERSGVSASEASGGSDDERSESSGGSRSSPERRSGGDCTHEVADDV